MCSSHVLRITLILTLALVGPVAAAEAAGRSIDHSRHLWATVNVCDTKKAPDTLGIRASMPGSGRKGEVMYMRFRAQYLSDEDNFWHDFTSSDGTDSGWVRIGSAKYKARQSGWSFAFSPDAGQSFTLRGIVRFEWRKAGRVVRSAVKRTTSGHHTAVADPKGYSRSQCEVKGAPAPAPTP